VQVHNNSYSDELNSGAREEHHETDKATGKGDIVSENTEVGPPDVARTKTGGETLVTIVVSS
jgi:hypothetical protein